MIPVSPAAGSPIPAPPAAASQATNAAELSTPAGSELYGYLPYWEMNATMAAYLPVVPLTTIGLFSVTATAAGALDHGQLGYRRITGQIGARLIAEAHARGQRVEIVFSSFGWTANGSLFGLAQQDDLGPMGGPDDRTTPPPVWQRTVAELVALAVRLHVDGINVDVEEIPGDAYEGYTAFLAALGEQLRPAIPQASIGAATMAANGGPELAVAAIAGGVDRIFLMGYGYHWSGSNPGATAPLNRAEAGPDLRTSIEAYAAVGVPADRILLGLPLYGMSWPVLSPELGAPRSGNGQTWVPRTHIKTLLSSAFASSPDWLESTEFFVTPDPAPGVGWHATYYDSPRTLLPKLRLARASGYAGAGFWAIGYERGLPGYLEVMRAFRQGDIVAFGRSRAGDR